MAGKQCYKIVIFLNILFLILFCYPNCSLAIEGISVASGRGLSKIVPIRLGLQKKFNRCWQTDTIWPIWGYWEGAVYSLKGQPGFKRDSHKEAIALVGAAAFRFEKQDSICLGWPYLELGIGVSWLSKKEIGGRDLGMHFQFEDRVGFGFRFGENHQYDIAYRAVHFSNAYIGRQNHGINLHLIVLGFWFQ